MKHKHTKTLFFIFVNIIALFGCSPIAEKNLIEEIAPVTFWSIQKGEDENYRMSTLIPPLVKEHKRLLTVQVDLLKEGMKGFNLKYYRELKVGQLRMLLISEEIAKEGISPLIDTILTDPDISKRLYLAVVRGNFDEYINNQLKMQEDLDYYLYRMFKHYDNQGKLTIINLHQFMKTLHSPAHSPVVPVFEASDENFQYLGTGIFKNDKLIETTNNMEEQIYQLIGNDHFLKYFAIRDLSIVLGHVKANSQLNIDKSYSELNLNVQLNGRLDEIARKHNILTSDELSRFESEIESYLEKQTTKFLKKLQENKVDPLQLRNYTLRPFSKPLNGREWLNRWELMKLKVDYDLKIQPLTDIKN
ncbi:Ger(x)C family spore germination protein [Fictibacillus sp. 5RED26]|uniref:Ger(x)C family spore germination protein n=1 Tax=Fictibacillus sp. 5RED26 TaxID=2745876 RepID=UPI0018CDDF7B|nr:Ger(x)C family spore germination protein [Fictibacillus sp. 5RED26]MBH0156905.1 Ger(x)C family spore germination protein [Fictibacillus sp. 5RED26]